MKLRLDFVTNSSSSSFTTLVFEMKDGTTEEYFTEGMLSEDALPKNDGNKCIAYDSDDSPVQVTTLMDLMGTVYFSSHSSVCAPIDIVSPVFGYLVGEVPVKRLINILSDKAGFKELSDIDLDGYDDEAKLRNDTTDIILSALSDEYDAEDLGDTDEFKQIYEKIKSIDHLQRLNMIENRAEWGEFMDDEVKAVGKLVKENELKAIDKNSPKYQAEFDRWVQLLKTKVYRNRLPIDQSLEALVEAALCSGNFNDLIATGVSEDHITNIYDNDN